MTFVLAMLYGILEHQASCYKKPSIIHSIAASSELCVIPFHQGRCAMRSVMMRLLMMDALKTSLQLILSAWRKWKWI